MKFYKLLFVSFLLLSFKSFATAQVPDYLIVGKDTLRIQSNPLEGYLKDHPIPENLITSVSSANWRGYIAYFKFLNGKLVVENIYKEDYVEKENGNSSFSLVSIYKEIFGKQKNFECNFYSGLLICPSGKMLQYVHMGYSSLYENYDLIEIKDGVNVKSKKFTAEEFQKFRKDYFRYFKSTEEYKIRFNEFKEMGFSPEYSNSSFLIVNPGTGRENESLKKKEAEFKVGKQIDSFMFAFFNDYIKTIEIPTK
ncbi:hypothetical protein EYY60_10015 [Flavobacterium zhairuonense]|uniref:hypothetical protein n=1 Tax=Flavobacterium zhairuonense TaxID=2493631 RepID=UPI00104C410A|nr:hypothetical protein [Flavobacterium zhairuonense]KAF2510832.1 hypothetical protein EYY60_10015 [Flavobacterium zhairuonense]